jgi:hypothetical protein
MDSHGDTVSLKDVEKFCSRLVDHESDTISDSELWAVMSQEELRKRLGEYDEKLLAMEQRFKDLALESSGASLSESEEGDSSPPKKEDFIEESLGLDQRSLRKFKSQQSDRTRLYDYLHRRIIKNNMEDLFGERGYENFQKLIFVLIFAVLAALVIEYAYFNDVFNDVNDYLEAKESGYVSLEEYQESIKDAAGSGKSNENFEPPVPGRDAETQQLAREAKEPPGGETGVSLEDAIEDKFKETKPFGFFEISLSAIAIFDVVVCIVFLFEYFLRLYFSEDWRWYFLNHKIDLVSSIPMSGIIILSGGLIPGDFMVLRAVRLFRIFRAMRIASFFWRGMERLEQVANVKLMRQSFMMFVLLAFLGGFMIQLVEQGALDMSATVQNEQGAPDKSATGQNEKGSSKVTSPDGKDEIVYVKDLDKSFWWAVTSLTSGGFGDLYRPKTTPGWVIVTLLVVSGLVVVGVFTATLTTIFKREEAEDMLHQQIKIHDDISEILKRVRDSGDQFEAIHHELHDLKQKYITLQSQVGVLARKEFKNE